MENSLFTEGKEYISSGRAAKIFDYSSDYIGQLCRTRKVVGKLVGRTWYVELDSLVSHRNNTRPGRVPVSGSRLRKGNGPIVYGSDHSELLPLLRKRKGTNGFKIIFNIEKTLALAVIAIVFVLGANSILRGSEDLLAIENLSLSVATAIEAASESIPYQVVEEKVKNVSLFGFSEQIYKAILYGFEDMRNVIEINSEI